MFVTSTENIFSSPGTNVVSNRVDLISNGTGVVGVTVVTAAAAPPTPLITLTPPGPPGGCGGCGSTGGAGGKLGQSIGQLLVLSPKPV